MKLLIDTSDYVDSQDVHATADKLIPYIEELKLIASINTYDNPEASLNLSFDDELMKNVEALADDKVTSELKYIFVVGIGGSNLGTKAVYDALYSMHDGLVVDRPKMIFVDTNNAKLLHVYQDEIIPTLKKKEEVLLITISKSGGTTETLANTEILINTMKKKFSDILDRVVVITDEGSAYWKVSEENNISRLSIPKNVGGRYSVLSAVGLFPLASLGLDVRSLRQGARDIRAYCINTEIEHNPAAKSASVLAINAKSGKIINDNFVFNSELESLGKWYRQLMGESIGKEHDLDGNKIHAGITPTVSVGSTDLHSVGQLYLGGPKDKITTFIYDTDIKNSIAIPKVRSFPSVVSMIDGKQTGDIMM